jgi:hypothetical protein
MKGGEKMKKPKKSTIKMVELIIKAILALSALITAIRWW